MALFGNADFGDDRRPEIPNAIIEEQLLQAVTICREMLPPHKRSDECVSEEIRRFAERMLTTFDEDMAYFTAMWRSNSD